MQGKSAVDTITAWLTPTFSGSSSPVLIAEDASSSRAAAVPATPGEIRRVLCAVLGGAPD
jgi:hypothetical protein